MFFLMCKAYLLGSIPFAYIFSRLARKLDIRKIGSRNVGTTNVFMQIGWLPAVLTAVGDVGKGICAVMLGAAAGGGSEMIALLLAMVGHNWPVWLRFHGGGGLATFVGGMLIISEWWIIPVLFAAWGTAYILIKEYNRSVLVACSLSPVLLGWLHSSWNYFLFGLGAGLVLGLKSVFNLKRAVKPAV